MHLYCQEPLRPRGCSQLAGRMSTQRKQPSLTANTVPPHGCHLRYLELARSIAVITRQRMCS